MENMDSAKREQQFKNHYQIHIIHGSIMIYGSFSKNICREKRRYDCEVLAQNSSQHESSPDPLLLKSTEVLAKFLDTGTEENTMDFQPVMFTVCKHVICRK